MCSKSFEYSTLVKLAGRYEKALHTLEGFEIPQKSKSAIVPPYVLLELCKNT